MKHYRCNKKGCNVVTDSRRAYRAHRAYHTRRSAHNQKAKCPHCWEVISCGNLKRHVRRNHPKIASPTLTDCEEIKNN